MSGITAPQGIDRGRIVTLINYIVFELERLLCLFRLFFKSFIGTKHIQPLYMVACSTIFINAKGVSCNMRRRRHGYESVITTSVAPLTSMNKL